ncbi:MULTISPECIES: hypothetical protein [Fructobacillus]|uniref:hypothetical protein n=1 Tax=Fructobacillus TaxID=559173 RepID=UPI00064D8833|nr:MULTISPECIES: hypothetical protein [Fructobacillus]KMK53648.1 hypothetical protein FEFB_05830 [Fructobacillus sp. EFB-N1]MCK8627018.1 hypothetical protein [Fructobacillus cardui]
MPLVNEHVQKINNAVYEPEKFDFYDPKLQNKMDNMVVFLGYKGLTHDVHNYIALKDGTYAELVLVRGMSIADLTGEQSRVLVNEAGEFFRAQNAGTNISFFGYSFKVNTHKQQRAWQTNKELLEEEIKNETNPRRKHQLNQRLKMVNGEINRLIFVENNFWSREFLMAVFAKNKGQLENKMILLRNLSSGDNAPFRFREMTRKEKEERLYALNNPASYID